MGNVQAVGSMCEGDYGCGGDDTGASAGGACAVDTGASAGGACAVLTQRNKQAAAALACLLRVSFHSSASQPHSISVGESSRSIRGARHLLTSLKA